MNNSDTKNRFFSRSLLKPKYIQICVIGFLIYVLAWFSFRGTDVYFNGDSGINALMAHDFLNGKLQSLYFYGQYYYGPLHVMLYAPILFFTGVSFWSMAFLDFTFYSLGILLIALKIKWGNSLQTIPFFSILFILNSFGYFPFWNGFGFLTFVSICIYLALDRTNFFDEAGWFFISFITGLCLWMFQLHIFAVIAFGSLLGIALISKKINFKNFKTLVSVKKVVLACIGFLIGLIPFIVAGIQTQWANLEWFTNNSNTSEISRIDAVIYYIRDAISFFVVPTTGPLPNIDFISRENAQWIITDSYRIMLAGVTLFFGALFAYSVLNYKKIKTELVIFLVVGLLLIARSIDRPYELTYIFEYARYSVFLMVIGITICFKNYVSLVQSNKWFSQIVSKIGFAAFVIIAISSVTTATRFRFNPVIYEQSYVFINEDLKSRDINYLYCYDYYVVCAQLSFLSRSDESHPTTIQIIDQYSLQPRDPYTKYKVDDALQDGQTIYSLIPENLYEYYRESSELITDYPGPRGRLYMVEGAAICAPFNADIKPEIAQNLPNCTEII